MSLALITAYCACTVCCGPHAAGITASGKRPVQGVTIAAPRHVPMGTRVHVAGLGWFQVQDRLARRFDDRWDVYFKEHETARRFGLRRARVTVAR